MVSCSAELIAKPLHQVLSLCAHDPPKYATSMVIVVHQTDVAGRLPHVRQLAMPQHFERVLASYSRCAGQTRHILYALTQLSASVECESRWQYVRTPLSCTAFVELGS